jgi:hypothetical protein
MVAPHVLGELKISMSVFTLFQFAEGMDCTDIHARNIVRMPGSSRYHREQRKDALFKLEGGFFSEIRKVNFIWTDVMFLSLKHNGLMAEIKFYNKKVINLTMSD